MRAVIALAGLVFAGTATAQQAPGLESVPHVTGTCAAVPMQVAPIPVVEVMLGDKGPYRFAIDTGAQGHGRIKPELAQALGLAQVGEVGTPAPGGTTVARSVFGVPALSVGGMTFHDLQLVDMSTARGPEVGWDGILGFALFQKLPITFDYGNGKLRLGGAGLSEGLPLTFDRVTPVISLDIAGKSFPVHLDTGNGASGLFLSEADAKSLPFAGEPIQRGKARTSFGEFAIMEAPLAVPVKAGAATLPLKTVGWPSARPGGNLGSRALAGMSLTIDQAARLVQLGDSGAAPTCPA